MLVREADGCSKPLVESTGLLDMSWSVMADSLGVSEVFSVGTSPLLEEILCRARDTAERFVGLPRRGSLATRAGAGVS